MYDELIKFIGSLGFPIVICFYFILKLEQKLDLILKYLYELHHKTKNEEE